MDYNLQDDGFMYQSQIDFDIKSENYGYPPLTGCQDATAPVFYERPAGNYTVEWMVERTSGTTTGSDTFTVYANDSITYLIT